MPQSPSGCADHIHFFSECSFTLKQKTAVRGWLCNVLFRHRRKAENLCYIFCSDRQLLSLNKSWLKHRTLTDVITFDNSTGKSLAGDVYISIDRVRANARAEKCSFRNELHRVMLHGLLHLLGYGDKAPDEVVAIRAKEDYCLSLRDF